MCGTNFESDKNFVINTPGLFGYFEGMKKIDFELSFTKPAGFYGATGLKPLSSDAVKDVYRCRNADELYDSPIMFSMPDTATIKVGHSDVLVAVYSPKKMASAKFIATHLEKLLMGTKDYLGGKLPVEKYAFIYYFNGEQKKMPESGAWEHSYSSFYSLDELPQEQAIQGWVDVSAHEFFHIVTPLTISSREVKEFNFNETHLSKHVWLYEGSTEYYAHHMQVWAGLRTPDQLLARLQQKILISRNYFNDSLSFTQLGQQSAGRLKDQYVNVYMKGALISACLDLKLLSLSEGQYGLKELKHDLGVRFGKDRFFEDDSLFNEIEKLTYPEIKEFLTTYVEGSRPIPYEEYFSLAGVQYIPKETTMDFSLGNITAREDSTGKLIIGTANLDDFGKKMKYQEGDELISINGQAINAENLSGFSESFKLNMKEGRPVEVVVRRKDSSGSYSLENLSAPAMKIEKTRLHQLRFINNPGSGQLKVREAWLHTNCKN
jgi:predicted metalloprotease with PDZ domain